MYHGDVRNLLTHVVKKNNSHLGDNLMFYHKTKHTLTNNHTPWYLPKELKTYIYTKTLNMDVCSRFTYNAKTCKQTRCPSVGEWPNKP